MMYSVISSVLNIGTRFVNVASKKSQEFEGMKLSIATMFSEGAESIKNLRANDG